MVDVDLVKAFLEVSGPWGLIGIILLFIFLWLRRDDKSIRQSLEAQITSFTLINNTLEKLVDIMERHDERSRDVREKQDRLADAFATLSSTVLAQLHVRGAGKE